MIQTKLFSDLYLSKFLNTLIKFFFSVYFYEMFANEYYKETGTTILYNKESAGAIN